MRLTKITTLLAAGLLVTGLAACGSDKKEDAGGVTTTVDGTDCKPLGGFAPITAGTLTVVTSLPGPGFWEGSDDDPSAVTSGFEYDIAQEMKAKFCLDKLEVRNESFDAITAGSVTDYDLALSQISITDERAKVVSFSKPYFESNQGILVKKGKKISTIEDVKNAKWGVQTGTTAIDLLDKIELANETSVYQTLPDAYTALDADQVDAILIDTAINLGQAARSDGKFEVVGQFEQETGPDQYGAILPKDSKNVAAIDAAFDDLKTSGKLAEIGTKNLSTDPGNIPIIKI